MLLKCAFFSKVDNFLVTSWAKPQSCRSFSAGDPLNCVNDMTCSKPKKNTSHHQQFLHVHSFSINNLENVLNETLRNWLFEYVKNESLCVFRLNILKVSARDQKCGIMGKSIRLLIVRVRG